MPPPQRAKPGRRRARCGARDGSPHPHSPHPQLVGSGPRPQAPKDGRSGVGRRPTPDPTSRQEAPPHGRPRAEPTTRKAGSQERLLWDWWRVPTPAPPAPAASGCWAPAASPKDGQSGPAERPTPDAPHAGTRRPPPPPGALLPPPQGAKPASKSARCGVGDGSPSPQTPHPQPVGSGPQPHAPKDGR